MGDPRRKQASAEPEAELVIPPPLVDNVIKPVVIAEPSINNLSRNDPRRRKLMEKTTPQSPPISREDVKETVKHSPVVMRDVINRNISQEDSDSDDGGLQIDEAFDEKNNEESRTLIMITESQLEVGNKTEKVEETSKDDVELWDEIYGSTN